MLQRSAFVNFDVKGDACVCPDLRRKFCMSKHLSISDFILLKLARLLDYL
jgi:hypothetical protein